jgi:chemotaxis methyl-accepting protein methylase
MTKLKAVYSSNTLIEAILKYLEIQYGLKINELNTDKILNLIYNCHIAGTGFDENALNVIDRHFSNLLLNNESYFFRYPLQLQLILEYCKSKHNPVILSIGCSKGQEAYSISMYLHKHIIDFQIYGVDIDDDAINDAKKATYSEYSLKALPEEYKKYFSYTADNKYKLSEDITKNVTFLKINILKEDISKMIPGADIILINNVLIYLNKKAIETFIETAANLLVSGGLLFTSEEEYSIKTFGKFLKEESKKGCKYYSKPDLNQIAIMDYRELFDFKGSESKKTFDYSCLEQNIDNPSLENAKDSLLKKDYLKAISICYKLITDNPLFDEPLAIMSECFYELGFNEEAKKWLRTFLIINSNNEEKIEQYLNLCLKTEDFFEYIRILKKKIALFNKKDDIIRLKNILERAGLNAEELSDYMQ